MSGVERKEVKIQSSESETRKSKSANLKTRAHDPQKNGLGTVTELSKEPFKGALKGTVKGSLQGTLMDP